MKSVKNAVLAWGSVLVIMLSVAPAFSQAPRGEMAGAAVVEGGQHISLERLLALRIPLFSPHFAETPVALVNDEPIKMWELARALVSRDSDAGAGEGEAILQDLLGRLINIRLIVQEARNIGLDEAESMQALFADFTKKSLLQELIDNQMKDLAPDPDEVEDLYRQMSREVQIHTLIFKRAEDAAELLEESAKGVAFEQLASTYIADGKATDEHNDAFMKISDLLPQVGEAAYTMKPGEVSKLFRAPKGFVLFQLRDVRFVADPQVQEKARQIVYERLKKKRAREYSDELIEKHAVIDEELFEQLDFEQDVSDSVKEGEKKPADFGKLLQDQRVLATIRGGEPGTITVADLARELKGQFFHGVDKAVKSGNINSRKIIIFSNMLFKITGDLEARLLKLDQEPRFRYTLHEFEQSTLFGAFVDKVVAPEVKLVEAEVRQVYDDHLDEYSSPVMLRIKSLVFAKKKDADHAFDRLHKGADFRWVSGNAVGLVDKSSPGVLDFESQLLTLSTLPEGLRQLVKEPRQGDSFIYAAPGGDLHYVLFLEQVFPPQVQPFDKVKAPIARKLYNEKIKLAVDEWLAKLKDAYETRIFITAVDE
ncbi:MAG: peptidyl-prolyl cis-trans isomerase [Deltaproteobacteria bacterium]|nr:peptidyl-prolyl cis-trans isomerase [Candidatus Anaeroferrophillus wilburensis]MBN2888003.1 peptidyl-prolyl cis-trans isomerase [Deltaproteobacteria bacterium]